MIDHKVYVVSFILVPVANHLLESAVAKMSFTLCLFFTHKQTQTHLFLSYAQKFRGNNKIKNKNLMLSIPVLCLNPTAT